MNENFKNGDWGLGIGDWGLGIGDWAQSPIPNPQSPNPQSPIPIFEISKYLILIRIKYNCFMFYLFLNLFTK
jgi:hypothetical protein